MKTKNFTPVIFRKFKEGDIIALFPSIPGDNTPWTCQSYQHIGQHGSADLNLIWDTKLAKPEEYKDLLEELISINYDDLKIYKKVQYWMTVERIKEIKRENNQNEY